jgi:transposase
MSDSDRETDRAGRRPKRFLSVTRKYEIWLQLVRQEVTIAEAEAEAEAAAEHRVDRSTVMRIRTVAKDGALAALAASKPGWGPRTATTSWRPPRPRWPG